MLLGKMDFSLTLFFVNMIISFFLFTPFPTTVINYLCDKGFHETQVNLTVLVSPRPYMAWGSFLQ